MPATLSNTRAAADPSRRSSITALLASLGAMLETHERSVEAALQENAPARAKLLVLARRWFSPSGHLAALFDNSPPPAATAATTTTTATATMTSSVSSVNKSSNEIAAVFAQ